MKYKIALVLPYFGRFNNYFQLFLNSCKCNPEIDFLIYTDDETSYDYPKNVILRRMFFEDFKKIIQNNFDFPISLTTPYKLCDFKPTYGEVLKHELAGYDFWGHCDCDLIWGKITDFISDTLLESYDKLFSRGHLTIYRNSPEVNSLYRQQTIFDYKAILSSTKSYAFDEWGGVSKVWEKVGKSQYDDLIFDDIICGLKSMRTTKEYRIASFSPYHGEQENQSKYYYMMKHIAWAHEQQTEKLYRLWINHGKIEKEEVLYIHLQKRKMKFDFLVESSDYMIASNRFISAEKYEINTTPSRYTLSDKFLLVKRKIKRILKTILKNKK